MKLSFMAGFAAGYVLGAKAGPQRYEQIKAAAAQVKENPTVQQTTHQVTEAVKGKASEAVSRVKDGNGSTVTPGPGTSTPSGSFSTPSSTIGTTEPSPLLAARTTDPLDVPVLPEDEPGSPSSADRSKSRP